MVVQTSFDGKLCAEAPMHKSCKVMESELFPRLMLQYKDVQGLMPPTLVVPVPHASTCHIHIISLFQFDHRPPKPGTDLGIRWDPMGSADLAGRSATYQSCLGRCSSRGLDTFAGQCPVGSCSIGSQRRTRESIGAFTSVWRWNGSLREPPGA